MTSAIRSIRDYRKNILIHMSNEDKEKAFNSFLEEADKLNLNKDEELRILKRIRGEQ